MWISKCRRLLVPLRSCQHPSQLLTDTRVSYLMTKPV